MKFTKGVWVRVAALYVLSGLRMIELEKNKGEIILLH